MPSSPVSSPPAAKRQRLETNGSSDILQTSTSTAPHHTNGEHSTSNGNGETQPSASSAPAITSAPAPEEPSDDEEPEEVVPQEEEDLGHRDMYLDTVS